MLQGKELGWIVCVVGQTASPSTHIRGLVGSFQLDNRARASKYMHCKGLCRRIIPNRPPAPPKSVHRVIVAVTRHFYRNHKGVRKGVRGCSCFPSPDRGCKLASLSSRCVPELVPTCVMSPMSVYQLMLCIEKGCAKGCAHYMRLHAYYMRNFPVLDSLRCPSACRA